MPRLPEIFDREKLPDEHREVHDYLVKTRGAVSAGFAPFLHAPEVASRVAHLGTYIRFESTLPPPTRELVAFTTSTELGNRYEQIIHARDAANQGVSQAAIDAVNGKGGLESVDEEEGLAIRAAREIVRDHRFSDSTFEAAYKLLGDQGTVELIVTIGYYAMLAYNHQAMEVRLPTTD